MVPEGSYAALSAYAFPNVTRSPPGAGSDAGSSGSTDSVTLFSPVRGPIAPSATTTVTWLSEVNTTWPRTPPASSSRVNSPALGGWLPAARSGGGSTQRYGAAGPSPSRSGSRASGERRPDHAASAAHTTTSARPDASARRAERLT